MLRTALMLGFASLTAPHPASACGLDSCPFPVGWHMEDARYRLIVDDEWSWINHDLAVAREALAEGDTQRATQIGVGLKLAVQLRRPDMEAQRGKERVRALERAIDGLSAPDAADRAKREMERLERYQIPPEVEHRSVSTTRPGSAGRDL